MRCQDCVYFGWNNENYCHFEPKCCGDLPPCEEDDESWEEEE